MQLGRLQTSAHIHTLNNKRLKNPMAHISCRSKLMIPYYYQSASCNCFVYIPRTTQHPLSVTDGSHFYSTIITTNTFLNHIIPTTTRSPLTPSLGVKLKYYVIRIKGEPVVFKLSFLPRQWIHYCLNLISILLPGTKIERD